MIWRVMIGGQPVGSNGCGGQAGSATAADGNRSGRQPQRTAAALLPSLMTASGRGATFCI